MEEIEQIDILLVEDNPIDAELAMHGLRRDGVANRITWLKDGEEAIDYLFRRGVYQERVDSGPRLVILDLKMPRLDGIGVLKLIKGNEATRRIPVVVMTSSREENDLMQSYDLGANSYVVKPLDFGILQDVVRNAGFYWLAVNQSAPR